MKKISINSFDGGIADNKFSTVANQFALGQGLNIDTPRLLTVNQALKDVGNTALKKAIRHAATTTGGLTRYWGVGGATNGVYGIDNTATTFSVKHTNSITSLIDNISAVKSSLVYTTPIRIGAVSSPFNSTGYNDSIAQLTNGVHPILAKDDIAYVGNVSKLSQFDLSTLTDCAINIETGYSIIDLIDDGNYIIILLASSYFGLPSKIYWWDTFSKHYNYSLTLPIYGNALGKIEGSPVLIGKNDGSIYSINQTGIALLADRTLLDLDTISIDYINSYVDVRSKSSIKAVDEFKGKLFYGIASGGGNTLGGIWSMGRSKPSESIVKNWEWRIMDGATYTAKIYSIVNQRSTQLSPENILICVRNTDYGGTLKTLTLDYANKVTDAFYESLVLDGGEPDKTKKFQRITVSTRPLAGSFTISVKINEASSWTQIGTYTGTGKTKQTFPVLVEGMLDNNVGENIQIRFDFSVYKNLAPAIKGYTVEYEDFLKR
jgi:hypothetical protein